jgi:hypothetical protein
MLSHEPIMRAIGARDLDGAEAAAIAHVRESNTLLLSMFQEVQVSGGTSETLSGSRIRQRLQTGASSGT